MGRLSIRKLPAAPAPIHTCALPEPTIIPVERRDLSRVTHAETVKVNELVPFGDWRPETVYFHCLRLAASGAVGYRGAEFFIEKGRVFEVRTSKTNRDR
jgi:hypothetical protein